MVSWMLAEAREDLSALPGLPKGSSRASRLERRKVHNLFCATGIVVCAEWLCLERGVVLGDLQRSLSSLNYSVSQSVSCSAEPGFRLRIKPRHAEHSVAQELSSLGSLE